MVIILKRKAGGINFSILGRGEDSMKHRKEYVKWDKLLMREY